MSRAVALGEIVTIQRAVQTIQRNFQMLRFTLNLLKVAKKSANVNF